MKKRILSFVLALCMIVSFCAVFASAADTFVVQLDANSYTVGQTARLSWNYYPIGGISVSYYEVFVNGKALQSSTSQTSILYTIDGSATTLQFYVQAWGYEAGMTDPMMLAQSNVVTATVTGAPNGVHFVQDLTNVQPMVQGNNSIYLNLPISVYLPTGVYNATWTLYQINRQNQKTAVSSRPLVADSTTHIATAEHSLFATINDLGTTYQYEINYYDTQNTVDPYYQQFNQYPQYSQNLQYQTVKTLYSQTYTLSPFSAAITTNTPNPAVGATVTLSTTLTPLFANYNITQASYQWYSGSTANFADAAMIVGATTPTYIFTLQQNQGSYYFCEVKTIANGEQMRSIASIEFKNTAASGNMANFKQVNSGALPFKDLPASAWYNDYVKYAYYLNLMQGTSSSAFNPNGNFRLSEAIAVAARIHAIYTTGTDSNFVQGSTWYQTYVDYAIRNNIIKSGDFTDYNAACTRAQMAYILSNALPATELASLKTVSSLPDVNNNTPYSSSIFTLYNAGVLTGSDKRGTFYPQNSIKRSEVSAIICRMAFKSMRSSAAIG